MWTRSRTLPLCLAVAFWAAGCAPQVVDVVEANRGGAGGGSSGTGALAGGGAGSGGAAGRPCDDPERDRDEDGTPDCYEDCPDQPLKTTPGICGCEFPDDDTDGVAGCVNLLDVLVHRYPFDGTGTIVVNSKGSADGVLVGGATLDGSGAVTLGGGRRGEYVDLPNGILSENASVTLEAFVRWSGGSPWQRIFDFGDDGSGTEGSRNGGGSSTYFFLTTQIPDDSAEGPVARVAYQKGGGVEAQVDAKRGFPYGVVTHVAVTFDYLSKTLALYMDGSLEGAHAFTGDNEVQIRLSEVNDINSWLGRSLYVADSDFGGLIYEFRIYSQALSAEQVLTSYRAGPDAAYLP